VFTRVITDQAREFDMVEAGYAGPLFAEISPRTFPVLVRTGSRLSQLRFRRGAVRLDDAALARLHATTPLVDCADPSFQGGVAVSVDLSGFDGLIGYRAKRHTGLVDVDRPRSYPAAEFWEPLRADGSGTLILDPGQFYILASKEAVQVPPDFAAEMVPFDPLVGEFRVHYAGFFDPGFGHAEAGGTAGGALARRAVHAGGRPDRRPARLRADGEPPRRPLRQRRRLELPGAGAEALEAFRLTPAFFGPPAHHLATARDASTSRAVGVGGRTTPSR
jgi:deoxycytidine triphosphate deaminase